MPDQSRPPRRVRTSTVFLVASCVALAVLVVLLARQNLALKHRLAESLAPQSLHALRPGDTLGPLVLVDGAGEARPLVFAPEGEHTLLLVYSARCPACVQTLPQWERLLSSSPTGSPRVVGVQVDAESALVDVPFPAYGVDPAGSAALEQIPFVPATVLLDSVGVVENVWFGVLGDDTRREIAARIAGGITRYHAGSDS